MIHPSHPALRPQGVGPISAANPPKPKTEQAHDGEKNYRSAIIDRTIDGPTVLNDRGTKVRRTG